MKVQTEGAQPWLGILDTLYQRIERAKAQCRRLERERDTWKNASDQQAAFGNHQSTTIARLTERAQRAEKGLAEASAAETELRAQLQEREKLREDACERVFWLRTGLDEVRDALRRAGTQGEIESILHRYEGCASENTGEEVEDGPDVEDMYDELSSACVGVLESAGLGEANGHEDACEKLRDLAKRLESKAEAVFLRAQVRRLLGHIGLCRHGWLNKLEDGSLPVEEIEQAVSDSCERHKTVVCELDQQLRALDAARDEVAVLRQRLATYEPAADSEVQP